MCMKELAVTHHLLKHSEDKCGCCSIEVEPDRPSYCDAFEPTESVYPSSTPSSTPTTSAYPSSTLLNLPTQSAFRVAPLLKSNTSAYPSAPF